MDLMTGLIIVLIVFGFWFLLSRRMDDIEANLETLGKSIRKENHLTKIQHENQN